MDDDELKASPGRIPADRIATGAGFTRFRRAAENPFDVVFEFRP